MTTRHKTFVSFHEKDKRYRHYFARAMGSDIIDRSVSEGDIDPALKVDTIRSKIRDEFIADATVTVVLIGPCTWQRKHVDWEIGSSLRQTKKNPRCGLIGILLPTHLDYRANRYSPNLIPPRLADNVVGRNSYARIYHWPDPWNPRQIRTWIHEAFNRRDSINPINSRRQFGKNRTTPCELGWSE